MIKIYLEFLFFKDPEKTSCVLKFLLRDSESDYIEVDCWGNEEFILDLKLKINIAGEAGNSLGYEKILVVFN